MKYDYIVKEDIGETLCPIFLVTRRPDNTGLYNMFRGFVAALDSAVPFKLFVLEDGLFDRLKFDVERYKPSSIIFFESFRFVLSAEQISSLKKYLKVKIALIFPWDSDVLDPLDLDIINKCVDVLLPICAKNVEQWRNNFVSSVKLDQYLIPLQLSTYYTVAAEKSIKRNRLKSILSIGGYHPRKCHETTIKAVEMLVKMGHDVDLRIHSNIDQGEFTRICELGQILLGKRFKATCGELSLPSLIDLYVNSDIYISSSQGEGCNIGLRSAIASGMPVFFSEIPGHYDLVGLNDYCIAIKPIVEVDAVYIERTSQVFGKQHQISFDDLAKAVSEFIRSKGSQDIDNVLISKSIRFMDERNMKHYLWDLLARNELITTKYKMISRLSSTDPHPEILIVPSMDAGFFSIFNTYLSHLVYWKYPSLYADVIPQWSEDAVTFSTGKNPEDFTSYCYSKKGEDLFQILFEKNDNYSKSAKPLRYVCSSQSYNSYVDPNLTFNHPTKLYKSSAFHQWRRVFNQSLNKHIDFSKVLDHETIRFYQNVSKFKYRISMMVRPPSHAIEQRDGVIANLDDYIRVAKGFVESVESKDCCIILTTDQDLVINKFTHEFPGIVFYRDIERVSEEQTIHEMSLSDVDRLKEGFQIQHLLTRNYKKRSSVHARDVILDVITLAMGDILVHVNSNIATAVSYFNPEIFMMHITSGDTFTRLIDRSQVNNTIPIY